MKYNGIIQCDNCGKVHPFKHLMFDAETKDYLCPTCDRNKVAKKGHYDNLLIYFIIGTVLLILLVKGLL